VSGTAYRRHKHERSVFLKAVTHSATAVMPWKPPATLEAKNKGEFPRREIRLCFNE
jgi:hypothetical protein